MGTHYRGSQSEVRALEGYIKLARASDAVSTRINGHLSDYDLTASQFGVLEAVYHLGPMQVGQLGQKILRSSGNMTLVVDNLVKRGLVRRRRRTDDRRCIDVHLTAEGRALFERIWPAHLLHVQESFTPLTPGEQETLAALCRKLGLAQNAHHSRDSLSERTPIAPKS